MRSVVFACLLAACEHGASPPAGLDAGPPPPRPIDGPTTVERCDTAAGTAAITAAFQDLSPQYARVFAGGVFDLINQTFGLKAFFTNEPITAVSDVISCEQGFVCSSVGFLVEANLTIGDELGIHPAVFRSTAGTWEATGTFTLTEYVAPDGQVGHLAGSIHVDSADPQVIVNGTFDHTFCIGLVSALLN